MKVVTRWLLVLVVVLSVLAFPVPAWRRAALPGKQELYEEVARQLEVRALPEGTPMSAGH